MEAAGGARRGPWREIALAVVTLVAVGLALEATVRLAGVPVGTHWINRRTVERSDDPELLFELRPGAVAHAEVDYRINEHRMRDDPVELAKPPGTTRVAALGDSITFGYWVTAADAYPAQLEALLAAPGSGDRFRVLNFGVPGYNLAQDAAWLERGALRFAPDLVILGFCLNDLESVFSYEYGLVVERERERRTASVWQRLWARTLDVSLFASWIDYRLSEAAVRRRFAERRAAAGAAPGPAARRARAERELDAGFARVARALRAGGGDGVPGLVAIFPTFDVAFERYPHGWLHALVAESARRHGLAVVDLLDCLRAYPLAEVRVDPIHPSPLGHRVAAHAIAEAVVREGLLGPDAPVRAPPGDCRGYRAQDFPTVRGY